MIAEHAGDEQLIVFAASLDVLERYLFGMFDDDIRESLGLPFLDLPWDAESLADGFELTQMVRGFRALARTGAGPVAAARDATLSLVTLVPLSHFLRLDVSALKHSFLSDDGSPLLMNGRYTSQGH